ncbi:MAG TPA: hypothetical protein DCP91_01675 [Eggerthellaceae bacterium]|nr:hypothetical protein [Eggerthellaceae bacterium]
MACTKEELAAKLRGLRAERRMTQQEVATDPSGNAVIEFESCEPPRISEKPYCEKTLMWPDETNTTTHHATIDWFTCPRKEAKRYRVTVEELS